LGEVLAIQSIDVKQSADQAAIDIPFDIFGCPVNGIGVPVVLWVIDCFIDCAVISRGVAFAEIVRFNDSGIATKPLLYSLLVKLL
jgi:hypothetical protein